MPRKEKKEKQRNGEIGAMGTVNGTQQLMTLNNAFTLRRKIAGMAQFVVKNFLKNFYAFLRPGIRKNKPSEGLFLPAPLCQYGEIYSTIVHFCNLGYL